MVTDLSALADNFALLIETMLKLIFRFGAPTGEGAEFCRRLHWRLRRLGNRFASLVARVRAGTLHPPRARAAPAGTEAAERKPRAPDPFPRQFAWLHKLLLPHLPPFAGQLCSLVAQPAMAELYSAAPQLGRVLRPLCHMLGAQPLPEWLKLPRRPRVRKPRVRSASPPSPSPAKRGRAGVRGASAPAPAAQAPPKPLNVTKLSSVAYGHFLHPENEKHPVGIRPPNRIGYARSRWPPDRCPRQAPKNRD